MASATIRNRRGMASRIFGVVAFSALVGACGNPAAATVAPTATALVPSNTPAESSGPSETPSMAPSVAASPSATAAKLCAREFEACPLPAGTYRAAPFEPGFTFTIEGNDWTNHRAWPHGGGVGYKDGAFWWMSDATAGFVDDKPVNIGEGPDALIAYLRGFDDWTIQNPQPITIDGVSGVSLDVVTGPKPRALMLQFPEDAFNTDPNERIQWIVFEKDGHVVQFLLDAFKKGNYDAVSSRIQPIIDSVAWE
jgi:hypothetical protein